MSAAPVGGGDERRSRRPGAPAETPRWGRLAAGRRGQERQERRRDRAGAGRHQDHVEERVGAGLDRGVPAGMQERAEEDGEEGFGGHATHPSAACRVVQPATDVARRSLSGWSPPARRPALSLGARRAAEMLDVALREMRRRRESAGGRDDDHRQAGLPQEVAGPLEADQRRSASSASGRDTCGTAARAVASSSAARAASAAQLRGCSTLRSIRATAASTFGWATSSRARRSMRWCSSASRMRWWMSWSVT